MILKVSVISLKVTDKFPNKHENHFFGQYGYLIKNLKIRVQQQEIVDWSIFHRISLGIIQTYLQ